MLDVDVVAFDVFGTVFDLSGVPREEVVQYIDHIEKPEWSPLRLPEAWKSLPAHPDAREGLERIRKHRMVVTCSNGPLGLLAHLSRHNGISWDAIIPLELNRVYKPDPKSYMTVSEVLEVPPQKILMVTANRRLGRRDFGDREASAKLGMQSILIRTPGVPDIKALAEILNS